MEICRNGAPTETEVTHEEESEDDDTKLYAISYYISLYLVQNTCRQKFDSREVVEY